MINYIIINGTNSNTINGLGINELPPISKPPLRVQTDTIDGRDGDITTNLGYGAYDKTITIGLFGTGYDINEVISFFNGEGTVVFSNEPDKYYKYKIIEQIDYEALLKFKIASITFHCQPFKYPLEETPIEIEYEYIEQEGVESATMNNTNGGTSLKIDLKGNTSQYSTTGKNLLENVGTSKTDRGLTFTHNADGSITISGIAEASFAYDINYSSSSNPLQFTEDTQVICSGTTTGSSSTYRIVFNYNYGGADSAGAIVTTQEKTFTFPANSYIHSYFYVVSGTNLTTPITIYPMIRLATIQDGTYEPYTNGASPNPDYPQPINVVSGDNEVKVNGKNLFNSENWYNTYHSVSSSSMLKEVVNGIEYYKFKINDLNNVQYMKGKFKENTQYKLTFKGLIYPNMSTGTGFAFIYTDGTSNQVGINTTDESDFVLTSSANKTIDYIKLLWGSQNQFALVRNLMLIEGTETIDYIPYQSQTYEIDLIGKNKFNKDDISSNGWSSSSSATYKDKITASKLANGSPISVRSGEKYTISWTNPSGVSINAFNLYGYDINGNLKITDTQTGWVNGTSYLIPENVSYINISSFGTQTEEQQQAIADTLMIEKGDTASSYEAYNSLELCKIGDYQDYFTKNSGKNIVNPNNIVQGIINDSNGNLEGTTISNNKSIDYTEIKPNTSYYFLSNKTSGNWGAWYDENKTYISGISLGATIDGVKVSPSNAKYLRFTLDREGNNDNYLSNVMICEGTSSIPYEPYGTGQWCKYNAIGKVVLDGSETGWQYFFSTIGIYTNASLIQSIIDAGNINCICNYFTATYRSNIRNNLATTNNVCSTYSAELVLANKSITSIDDFKTWLSTHNTIVYYVLATPYLSLIEDETLISQLDNIQNAISYEGQTNVSQENNDKPFLLDLIAMKDGSDEVVINNIGNTYAKPTIALEGTGITDIYLNDTEILKVDLTDTNTITIDTNNMEAYNPTDNTLANRKVVGNYNSMTLPSGNTTMKITGALTKATITDYSRWL